MKVPSNIIILCILIINTSFSQSIEWGNLNSSKTKDYYPIIVGDNDSSIYTCYYLDKDLFLESHSKGNMRLSSSIKVEMEKVRGNKVEIRRVNFINDKFLVFASYFDKKSNTSKVFVEAIDAITLNPIKKIDLFDIDVDGKKGMGKFYVFLSPNKSKMLIYHYSYSKKYKQFKNVYKLIDEDLNIVVGRNDVVDKKDKDYKTFSYVINDEGSLFFLKKMSESELHIVSFDSKRNYEKWEEKVSLSDIGMSPNSAITDLAFNVNAQNDIILSGYYTKDQTNLNGCFFLKINGNTKETIAIQLNEFSQNFINKFSKKKWLFEGSPELLNEFKSVDIINKPDGGIILIGEKYEKKITYNPNGSVSSTKETFGDLIVLNISPMGILIWANRVPKLQKFNTSFGHLKDIRTSDYFSYLIGINNETVTILFNDHKANSISAENERKLKALKSTKNAYITMYNIDLITGSKKKTMFSDTKSLEIVFKPTTSFQKNSTSNIFIFGRKNKKYKYGLLKL